MNSNISLNTTTTTTVSSDVQYATIFNPNYIKFGILLALQLLSVPCYLWIFYQFARQQQLRSSAHHHVILLLLIVSFLFVTVALPLTEAFMFTSYVYPATESFCAFWTWIHYSLNIINLFLMAFASLERNWLIFHPWLIRKKLGKIIFHYCPLVFCVLYPSLIYFGLIFIYKCDSSYDFTQLLCAYPCYFYSLDWANFDLFFNNYVPLFGIPVFCIIIYVRVMIQKRAMKQEAFKWKRDKKMILQLWAISTLYLSMWMPLQLTVLIQLYWDPSFLYQAEIGYMYLFPYLIHLIYPFIVLLTYRKEMLNFKRNVVAPQVTATGKRNLQTNFH